MTAESAPVNEEPVEQIITPELPYSNEALEGQTALRRVKEMPALTPEEELVVALAKRRLASISRQRNRGEWGTSVPSSLSKLMKRSY